MEKLANLKVELASVKVAYQTEVKKEKAEKNVALTA